MEYKNTDKAFGNYMALVTNSRSSKNNNYRAVTIKNFRNLGLKNETSIVINRTIEKDQLGNVVIIVGQNNSGKSNVLDAIEVASTGKREERDIPDKSLSGEDLIPTVKFDICDGKNNYLDYRDSIQAERTDEASLSFAVTYNLEPIKGDEHYHELIDKVIEYFTLNGDEIHSERAKKLSLKNDPSSSLSFVIASCNRELLVSILGEDNTDYLYKKMGAILTFLPTEPRVKHLTSSKKKTVTPEESAFEEEYGYKLVPNIVKYKEVPIQSSDLVCPPSDRNKFIKRVLKIIIATKEVDAAYDIEDEDERQKVLKDLETVLNNRLYSISDEFNRLKMDDDFNYHFELNLGLNEIRFVLKMGTIELILDRQSTGFRWFFNFFFNLIIGRVLNDGDIVILDEPATNLHVSGQMELKRFLQRYSKTLNITFIISTHSPFFIDCDYLDEVRVVRRIADGSSIIEDKFSVIDSNNPDQMDYILRSLTIGRNVLINSYNPCIYVEGITDYNYLVAFKLLLDIKDITFIPINGVGANDAERDTIIHKLLNIDRSPVLLADADKNGYDMKRRARKTKLKVITLSDIDSKFKTIESLFTISEQIKFDLRDKGWNNSSNFKHNIFEYSEMINDTTKENFRKVIEYLISEYTRR